MIPLIARLRVPLGFAVAAVAFWFARPTGASIAAGMTVAALGELLRIWAAGHIDKGREVTRSGPYRFVRHPLYLGSAIMGAGFVVAARSLWVGGLVGLYLLITLVAAMRTEEAALAARFGEAYAAYREGRPLAGGVPAGADPQRRFSWSRVAANREHRAVMGLVVAGALLVLLRTIR
jgi:protein-S-isoprenylcysteine O-methyltransferase Ste14